MSALIGMSAMFAGASRAYLTSITFALESTGQLHALLPLLGACTASYLVSFFLMENTIMTEKIARRGVSTPDSFEPDVLGKLSVGEIVNTNGISLNPEMTMREIRELLKSENNKACYFIVTDQHGNYVGTANLTDINKHDIDPGIILKEILQTAQLSVKIGDNLRKAVELMAEEGVEALPVTAGNKVIGVLSYKDIINAYKSYHDENDQVNRHISLKRERLKVLVRSRGLLNQFKDLNNMHK
jgi:CBS domain-containing protein